MHTLPNTWQFNQYKSADGTGRWIYHDVADKLKSGFGKYFIRREAVKLARVYTTLRIAKPLWLHLFIV